VNDASGCRLSSDRTMTTRSTEGAGRTVATPHVAASPATQADLTIF
jgi:hypothetical protein